MNDQPRNYELGFDSRKFLDLETPRPDLPTGSAFEAHRVRLLSVPEFYALSSSADQLSTQQLVYMTMLDNLIWSSHNTNPRRVSLVTDNPNTLNLWADRKAVLPISDPSGRQTAVGMGAALQGFRTIAQCYGLRVWDDIRNQRTGRLAPFNPKQPRYEYIAQLDFELGQRIPENASQILQSIKNRRVVRARYNSVALPTTLHQQIKDLRAIGSVKLNLIEDPATKLVIARAAENAEKEVFENIDFKQELGRSVAPNSDNTTASAMRFQEFMDRRGSKDDKEAERLRQGLLGVPGMIQPVELFGMAHATYQNIASSSAIAIFTSDLDILTYQMAAGELGYQLALLATQHNFVTAVHAGVAEVEDARRELTSRYFPGEQILGLVRIGKVLSSSALKRPHSSRPAIEELFI